MENKEIIKIIEEVYLNCKTNEREELNKLPLQVAIRVQSGYLLGFANGVIRFREQLLNKFKEKKEK